MGTQTKGFCKYCGKEYTRSGMLRHLEACKERKSKLAMETYKRKCRYFQIVISGKYAKAYWLIVEVSENTTLKISLSVIFGWNAVVISALLQFMGRNMRAARLQTDFGESHLKI